MVKLYFINLFYFRIGVMSDSGIKSFIPNSKFTLANSKYLFIIITNMVKFWVGEILYQNLTWFPPWNKINNKIKFYQFLRAAVELHLGLHISFASIYSTIKPLINDIWMILASFVLTNYMELRSQKPPNVPLSFQSQCLYIICIHILHFFYLNSVVIHQYIS